MLFSTHITLHVFHSCTLKGKIEKKIEEIFAKLFYNRTIRNSRKKNLVPKYIHILLGFLLVDENIAGKETIRNIAIPLKHKLTSEKKELPVVLSDLRSIRAAPHQDRKHTYLGCKLWGPPPDLLERWKEIVVVTAIRIFHKPGEAFIPTTIFPDL